MILHCIAIHVMFVALSFNEFAESKEPELTEFGKEVKNRISNETYHKIFHVHPKDIEELLKAIASGTKNFYEVLGIPYNETAEENVEKENKEVGLSHIKTKPLFYAQTAAISEALKHKKLLHSTTIGKLAQKLVDYFDDAAKDKTDHSIKATFIAQTTAVAKFLKSEEITTEEAIKKSEKKYIHTLNEFKKKDK